MRQIILLAIVLVLAGCHGMGFTRVKSVSPTWAEEGNLAIQVLHMGGGPRSVRLAFYLDGEEVGQDLSIVKGLSRPISYKINLHVPLGEHVLGVQLRGQDVLVEERFTIQEMDEPLRASVVYDGKSDAKLEVWFNGWIGFAKHSPNAEESTS